MSVAPPETAGPLPARVLVAGALCAAVLAAGCNVVTARTTCDEFPASAGFQPLERDFTDVAYPPAPGGVYPQAINVVYGPSIAHSWAHGRGWVRCAPATVYQALRNPAASRILAPGDHWSPTAGVEAGYDISFRVDYVVYETITVRWSLVSRGGIVAGTAAGPQAFGLRYQRTCGDEHISLQSGSLQAWEVPGQPGVTQVELVGWLNATTQGPPDVGGTLRDWFSNLTGVLAGLGCP